MQEFARDSVAQNGGAFSANDWQHPFQQGFIGNQAVPPSMQDEIISSRADSVTQFLGQVTPPNDDSADVPASNSKKQVQTSDAVKRKERARNAANKRHAKSKKVSIGSESTGVDDDGGEERGERQAHYREKNRVAAAKCRAKKKNHNDHLEEIHRDEASKNKILRAELMGLRNELAQLKGLTLEHSPDSCQCHGIHKYSMRQASLIARGAAPQYNPSPTQESTPSIDTPTSETTVEGLYSGQQNTCPGVGTMSRRTSSFAPGNWMQPS